MSLDPGQKLTHFSIETKLGEGGMGEVYRAVDTKLDRKVALKVLPEAVAASPERLARFEREAKALAALNHPNVAGIHQVEHDSGVHFLVMELAEGQTLAEKMSAGPIGVEQALPIALQIAEGLESAHDRGIIHRDLKPANVMLASDGTVKVLDFGLARAMDTDPGDSVPGASLATHSPTFTAHVTGAGMLLGTAAYMSPEQARGDVADRRADIWAFGIVLFEMLTGDTVYAGKTLSDTLAGVLARDPAWDKLPEDLPRPIRRLLERCLHKETSERLQAIGEARIAIRDFLADPDAAEGAASATESAPTMTAPGWGRVAMVGIPLLLIGALGAWMLKPAPPAPAPLLIEAALPIEGVELMSGIASSVVLSSDGAQLAYFTGIGTNPTGKIRVHDIHKNVTRTFDDIERGYNVFFSPNGDWLGYVTPQEMFKVAVTGGAPLKLASVNRSRGASWGEDGTIVYAPDQSSGLYRIHEAGGEPTALTPLEEGEMSHRYPQHLPGGTHVVYTALVSSNPNDNLVKIVDLESGTSKVVHRGGTFARYSPSGHLLFWRDATIFGAPFDIGKMELSEIPIPVLQGVLGNSEGGAHYDVAADGTLVYAVGEATESIEILLTLQWLDRAGDTRPITSVAGQFSGGLELSPDEKKAAVTRWLDGNGDIWLIDFERETPTRLTFDDGVDVAPMWSPDGKTVYWSSRRGGPFKIYSKPSDGSDDESVVVEAAVDNFLSDVSSDGKWLLYTANTRDNREDIWVAPVDGSAPAREFLSTGFSESDAVFSPDGKWVAYQSDESGAPEIYVRPFPGPGGRWQVSASNGRFPRWSADGTRLFYIAPPTDIMEVPVSDEGAALQAGRAEKVVTINPSFQRYDNWTVSRDGNRFGFIQSPDLVARSGDGTGHVLVRYTFNWFGELREAMGE